MIYTKLLSDIQRKSHTQVCRRHTEETPNKKLMITTIYNLGGAWAKGFTTQDEDIFRVHIWTFYAPKMCLAAISSDISKFGDRFHWHSFVRVVCS